MTIVEKNKIPKIKNRFEVRNEADSDTATLYLHGTIGGDFWDYDYDKDNIITSKKIRKALKKIGDKDINLHINSGGGDVFESIAIGNMLKQHGKKVNVIIDGLAGSGASIVAMSGNTIQMFSNSMMMIHRAWTWTYGNANELEKVASDLRKIDGAVVASYKGRFIGTDDELENLINEETWLKADECMTLGFCDEVLEEVEETREKDTKEDINTKEELLNKYSKDFKVAANTKDKENEKKTLKEKLINFYG